MTYFDYIVSEFKTILKDEGVMLFFLFLPLVYPLLYSWIYNNEVTREVPIVVVDDSHTSLSREYIRKIDSSPDVCVAMQCRSIMEGRDAIGHGEAYGVVYFPRDFELKSVRGEQTHVGLYCDMSYLLNYKAIYQTVNKVNIEMWSKLQRRMQPKITMRDEAVAIHPLEFDEVPIFNVTGGYGNFILPAVLVLIIQQALLLGVGMLAGTRREKLYLTNVDPAPTPLAELLGRATAYFLIFAVMLAWITLIVPRIFGFVSLVHALDLFMLLLPYLVACVFFAMFMGNLVSYRESVMLVVVYTSLPLLFLSGVSWPQSSMSPFWQGVSYLFPSTFAIRGFIRMNSMGALLGDCIGEWITLWLQAVAYFLLIIAINKMNISKFLNNKGATATLLALVCVTSPTHAADDLTLWYNRPAQYWEEALPIGNGRIGAMISGSVETDTLQLNEDTFWSGSPYNNYNANCLPHLQEMRDLIAQGTAEGYIGAQKLALQNIVADIDKTGHGMAYESVGRLLLTFGHSSYTNYRRWLDLSTATAGVSYDCNGITYERTYFSSFIDKIIFVRLTAKKKGKYINPIKEKDVLTPKFKFLAPEKNDRVKIDIEKGDPSMIVIKSSLVKDSMEHVANKVECYTLVRFIQDDKGISMIISMGTNFTGFANGFASAKEKAAYYMDAFSKKVKTFNYGQYHTNYHERALYDHTWKYKKMFNRVTLDLGCDSVQAAKDTETRIREFSTSHDPSLVALYFQFGRYLLISSSQPDTQPANLQGIWNPDARQYPAWDSKYTTNINVEMNYWPAEVTNLSECHEPFLKMVKEVSISGQETARKMYGARGWVLHHNTDLWRATGAVDNHIAAIWPTGGAWFCSHIWEHWLFTGDKNFLREYYPVMKGASQFFQDYLYRDPVSGYMVAGPSVSPENHPGIASYIDEKTGKKQNCAVFSGITMDNQLIFDLLRNTAQAARELSIDAAFADSLDALRAQLPPMKIGKYGQLQEWLQDWDQEYSSHRHISHLWGAFPGNLISPYSTPELFRAVRKSLIGRGDASRGWSMGWKVCQWARQHDGNHALQLIKNQLKLKSPNASMKDPDGGTYANMFDAHPPFQIDGNFGCCAGIAEMLVQSHDGAIHILPAIPDEWAKEGCVTGLRARGGFEIVKLQWRDGRINHLVIKSTLGGNLRLRTTDPLYTVKRTKVPVPYHPARHTTKIDLIPVSYNNQLSDIPTTADEQIEIVTAGTKF